LIAGAANSKHQRIAIIELNDGFEAIGCRGPTLGRSSETEEIRRKAVVHCH
jgi:hypothetical protein